MLCARWSVMIAQCEDECSSLSVLSMAWVMRALWEDECISLAVLSMARVMITQWEDECISLSVFSMVRVMIAQLEKECISLSALPWPRVQFSAVAEYFKGVFPGWSHSANPSWASVAENGSIAPQWHRTTCGQRGGRPTFNYGQTDRQTDRQWLLKACLLRRSTWAIKWPSTSGEPDCRWGIVCFLYLALGKRQPMTTQIWICCFIDFIHQLIHRMGVKTFPR